MVRILLGTNNQTFSLLGMLWAMFQIRFRVRIRIHQIHVFFGLPDPDPHPLVKVMDQDPALDPDSSIIMQK